MNSIRRSLPFSKRESSLLFPISICCKRFPVFAGAVAGLLAFSPSSAFYEIARGELILNTTLQASYDSNIFGSSDAEDDIYFSLIPELQFLRQAGLGTIDARAGVNITRFMDFSDEDFEDFFASLKIGYPVHENSPLSGEFFAQFVQRSAADDFLNTRVQTEVASVGLNTLYRVSDRLGLRNSLSYSQTKVKDFSDVTAYSATLGLQWAYSRKLAWFTDYRFRRSQSTGDNPFPEREVDNIDHALFFGATGVLGPRVQGSASVGYQHTDARGDEGDRGLLVTAADLTWAWRPRTSLSLSASRDLDVSPTDETVESTNALLGIDHTVDPKISLNGYLGYRQLSFRGTNNRRDDALLTGAGIRYILTRYWLAGLNYSFIYNASNLAQADYSRHLTELFTRYSF